jgi:hypothetical protein
VATEKQIAANRANARLTCGPKTLAGKSKSSRNAYRHRLSAVLPPGPASSAKVDTIAHLFAHEQAIESASATDFARAQLELLRIRSLRAELMAKLKLNDVQELHRIAALDRYERYSLTRRRRASLRIYRLDSV